MDFLFNMDAIVGKIMDGSGLTLGVMGAALWGALKVFAKRSKTTLDDELIDAVEDAKTD